MNPPSTFVIARPKAVAIHGGNTQKLDRRATVIARPSGAAAIAMTELRVQFC